MIPGEELNLITLLIKNILEIWNKETKITGFMSEIRNDFEEQKSDLVKLSTGLQPITQAQTIAKSCCKWMVLKHTNITCLIKLN